MYHTVPHTRSITLRILPHAHITKEGRQRRDDKLTIWPLISIFHSFLFRAVRTGHDPVRPTGRARRFSKPRGSSGVGSERRFEISRDGSGLSRGFPDIAGREGCPWLDLTRKKPCFFLDAQSVKGNVFFCLKLVYHIPLYKYQVLISPKTGFQAVKALGPSILPILGKKMPKSGIPSHLYRRMCLPSTPLEPPKLSLY